MSNVDTLKARCFEILADAKGTWSEMDEVSEWDSLSELIGNASKITSLLENIAITVEIAANDLADTVEGLQSGDKLDAAAAMLDDLIKLPWYLEIVDGDIFRIMIGMAVEGLNRRFGKAWDLTKLREAAAQGRSFVDAITIL
jgi:hypothetical protein